MENNIITLFFEKYVKPLIILLFTPAVIFLVFLMNATVIMGVTNTIERLTSITETLLIIGMTSLSFAISGWMVKEKRFKFFDIPSSEIISKLILILGLSIIVFQVYSAIQNTIDGKFDSLQNIESVQENIEKDRLEQNQIILEDNLTEVELVQKIDKEYKEIDNKNTTEAIRQESNFCDGEGYNLCDSNFEFYCSPTKGGTCVSENSILCNGEYVDCVIGSNPYCSLTKGGICVSEDSVLCNGEWWFPCDSGFKFYCSTTTGPYCDLDNTRHGASNIIPRDIDALSIVGLHCHYKSKRPQNFPSHVLDMLGSGVIINPEGYILTVKHLVDPQWINFAFDNPLRGELNDVREFLYCEVALPPKNITLPTIENIKNPDLGITIDPPLPYIATLYFNPQQGDLSDLEYSNLDFAILKITEVLPNCLSFVDLCDLPSVYPYSPVFYNEALKDNDEIINFGYPSVEYIYPKQGTVTGFILKGAVGFMDTYYRGDQYFENLNFIFNWSAYNIVPGSSGSPIFYKGYVTGIQYAGDYINDKTSGRAIGLPAIQQVLIDNGLENLLSTE